MRPLSCLILSLALTLSVVSAQAAEPVDQVNPFVGSEGDFGQLTPAATAPYGMVQLGPDTTPANHAGYDATATRLVGFSHTRAVGVGCGGAGGDLLINVGYAGREAANMLDKATEEAKPGWYRVIYGPDRIEAQMVATGAAGIARFSFVQAGTITVRLDAQHAYSKRVLAQWDSITGGNLRTTLSAGTVCNQGVYHLWTASTLLHNDRVLAQTGIADGEGIVTFQVRVAVGDTLELRTGLSTVGSESAVRVRDTELGRQAFDTLRQQTRRRWNTELKRIVVRGEPGRTALFYTHLFRTMQTPVRIDDVDGTYRAADGRERQVEPGHHRYSSWAVWDNYRTQLPLLALIDPDRSADFAASLAELYAVGKPLWATAHEPFITVRTEHGGVALLDYWRKGVKGFDPVAILPLMAEESARIKRDQPDQKLEAAYDDWAVWQLAADLGQTDLASRYKEKTLTYRDEWLSVFKQVTPDFDIVKARGLYQGTLWQYRWAPVFDLDWVINEALGRDRFNAELTRFFSENLFNMTNQPDIQTPFLFTLSGAPRQSEMIVDQILNTPMDHGYANEGKRASPWRGYAFQLAPAGYADGMDDDAGGMAAWYIWASLGLYPAVIGEPRYTLTTPMFDRAVVTTAGRPFSITRKGARGDRFVAFRTLNGKRLEGSVIGHNTVVGGGELAVGTAP